MEDIFCKIVKGEIPSHKVYEDEENLAFLDVNPSSPGHTLIIPKKHGLNIHDFDKEELGGLMEVVEIVAGKIQRSINPDSMTIGINHNEKTGVPHLHFHIIPRWDNDGGKALQGLVRSKTKEDLKEIAKKIEKA